MFGFSKFFKELFAEDKICIHSKLLGLFKEIPKEKAIRDIDFLLLNFPENEVKNYFKKVIEKKQRLFPPFIEALTAGHFTANPAESINHIIRGLKKNSELCDEINLLNEKLPGDVYNSRIQFRKFEQELIEKIIFYVTTKKNILIML